MTAGAASGTTPTAATEFSSAEFDQGIFSSNTDYATILQTITVLEQQLKQAHNDIISLSRLKEEALTDPGDFVKLLSRPEECQRCFPRMQAVVRLPEVQVSSYQRRYSRRGSSKYEQNLEYLIARINELQKSQPSDPSLAALLSTSIPISSTPLSTRTLPQGEDSPLSGVAVRERFREIAGMGVPSRAASAPAIIDETGRAHLAAISTNQERASIFSPMPIKANSVQFSMPLLPPSSSSAEASRSNTPAPSNPTPSPIFSPGGGESTKRKNAGGTTSAGGGKRGQSLDHDPILSSHYNLPWSEEEKRRLLELMQMYPEEEVHSRRYAKIAAALGTRTASQVANRITKLSSKKRRRLNATDGVDSGGLDVEEEEEEEEDLDQIADEKIRSSSQYQEYLRLKRQVELLESDPNLPVHGGFRCDGCQMEPIIGTRWRCTKCHEPAAIDLCDQCIKTPFRTATHRPDHKFVRQ